MAQLNSKLGLSLDDTESLEAFVRDDPRWPNLVSALSKLVFDSCEMAVLNCNSSKEKELVLLKAKAEGAKKAIELLVSLEDAFKRD